MDRSSKELLVIILTIIILGISVSYLQKPTLEITLISLLAFGIIIIANTIVKKITAYFYEIDITIKPWSLHRFGFRNDSHFKEPIPMSWLPLGLALLTNAKFWWLAITQFEPKNKPERVARRHGYYRFTEKTEWDIGQIAMWGVITNLLIGLILLYFGTGYFNYIGKLNIYYAAWSLLPFSNLDGMKILFGSRPVWILLAIPTLILTIIALSI